MSQLIQTTNTQLITQSLQLAKKARQYLEEIDEPSSLVETTHDVKAIRDRVRKLKLAEEEQRRANIEWGFAWLDGIRRTGRSISKAGIKAGNPQLYQGDTIRLDELNISRNESSRWQRIGQITDDEFKEWEDEFRSDLIDPTFSRLMAYWRLLYGDPEWKPLPEGIYEVIYADPPWRFGNEFVQEMKGQSADSQYPTMTTESICQLPIHEITNEKSVLFLWVPNSMMMNDGRRVMEAWKFPYKTCMVWVKPKGPSLGWWLYNRHEMLLIGARDEAEHPIDRPDSVFEAPVGRHSQKPEKGYEIIENAFEGPFLELFARNDRKSFYPSFEELFYIIQMICEAEDLKYPRTEQLGRLMVEEFLYEACQINVTWEDIEANVKFQLWKRESKND